MTDDISEESVRIFREGYAKNLEKIPKPQWTTTPPTEPGWYFWRSTYKTESMVRYVGIDQKWDHHSGKWWPVELGKLAGVSDGI